MSRSLDRLLLFLALLCWVGCGGERAALSPSGEDPAPDMEAAVGPCETIACLNAGTCVEREGVASCDCGPFFEGPTCAEDVDECAEDNGGCGDPMEFLCVDQRGQAPLCEVIAPVMPEGPMVRAPCFDGDPVDPELGAPPETCTEVFESRPELGSGCYLLSDGMGGSEPGYCWHHKVMILLVNNEIEGGFHPDDLDEDGVVDQGALAGQNWPGDPFDGPEAVAAEVQQVLRQWFAEVSYGAVHLDASEVYWEPATDESPARWFRLLRERPGFANEGLFDRVCQLKGGSTVAEWRQYQSIITVISHGTTISGSQGRTEFLPIGEDCAEREEVWRNYVVMKNFRQYSRMGTFIHEVSHGLARDPFREPSIGHSEAINAADGSAAEYGDLTDVMGASITRGHLSLPQKLFLRYLPPEAVEIVEEEREEHRATIFALESRLAQTKGLYIPVAEGRDTYVEVRRPLGNDDRLSSIFHAGVLIKRANVPAGANKSWIHDPTPETPTNNSADSVLLPHRTYVDAENGLTISLLSNETDRAEVVVRRGPISQRPPEVSGVTVSSEGGLTRLSARAQPGEEGIPQDDLLYFWKVGAREGLTTPNGFRPGAEVVVPDENLPQELWLLVSDQRGGQTWHQVEF